MSFLTDGHGTLIEFADFPTVKFREKEVTPPGFDGGPPNDFTSMRNETVTSRAPQKLYTMTDMTVMVYYDPEVIEDLPGLINHQQLITVTHSDGSGWDFWGYLQKFTPGSNKKGEAPTATIVITPTNLDASQNEAEPTYVAPTP